MRTREQVRQLLDEGLTRGEVARQLGLSKATVSYHARRLDFPIDDRCNRRYDWREVQAYYDQGHTVTQCQERFGFARETWNAARRRGVVAARPRAMPVEALLSTRRNRSHLKKRLLRLGLKQDRCESCGLSEWRGLALGLALHHVNGDGSDNRIENLQLLCPNCHSQTETFAGRNRSRRTSARSGGSQALRGP